MAILAVFSDTHLKSEADADRSGPDECLATAVRAVAGSTRPDLVVLSGDIADDGSASAYDRVAALVAPLGAPVLATAGNHDLSEVVAEAFGSTDAFDLGEWRIVAVDTVIPGEIHGRVDARAVADRLGDDDGRPTVLVIHHPAISVSSNPWFNTEGSAELVAVLSERTDVRLVVSGHVHAAFEIHLAGVVYLGCPSTWYAIDHHGDRWTVGDGVAGATLVTLGADGAMEWAHVPNR